jgi:hypothetical protein
MALSASPLLSHDRRRELSRQVRDAFPQMGVYAIRNVTTGTVLVAASRDVPAAMNRIRFELQRKGCRNHQLQQDWDHFGPGAFRFEALELVREREDAVFDYAAELDTLLQLWTSELCPEPGGAQ